MVEHHDPQLVDQHDWSEIGHGAMRHTSVLRDLVREFLDDVTDVGGSRKRALQRQLLPPSDHAL